VSFRGMDPHSPRKCFWTSADKQLFSLVTKNGKYCFGNQQEHQYYFFFQEKKAHQYNEHSPVL